MMLASLFCEIGTLFSFCPLHTTFLLFSFWQFPTDLFLAYIHKKRNPNIEGIKNPHRY